MLLSRYHLLRHPRRPIAYISRLVQHPVLRRASATITAIQIKKRAVCLTIPIMITRASTAAIIEQIGELMNSAVARVSIDPFASKIPIRNNYGHSVVQLHRSVFECSLLSLTEMSRQLRDPETTLVSADRVR